MLQEADGHEGIVLMMPHAWEISEESFADTYSRAMPIMKADMQQSRNGGRTRPIASRPASTWWLEGGCQRNDRQGSRLV